MSLLRANSRTPAAVLARELQVNRATVTARIERLVEHGVIEAFTIRLTDEVDRDALRGITMVSTEPRHGQDVIRALRGLPQVEHLHSTVGAWDLVVHVRASSVADYDVVLERIRGLSGVTRTETSLLWNSLTDHQKWS